MIFFLFLQSLPFFRSFLLSVCVCSHVNTLIRVSPAVLFTHERKRREIDRLIERYFQASKIALKKKGLQNSKKKVLPLTYLLLLLLV